MMRSQALSKSVPPVHAVLLLLLLGHALLVIRNIARASGDNTMEETYENEESEAIYREARARKGPHIERYPVAQIPVRLEHAAGRGEGRSAPTAGGIASVLAFHQSSRDCCARVHSPIA